ncbi:bifunctional oligoribonuclease/PAP phosphatase NrnA [Gordonia jinhuaensis]|uniref:Phosphoesterase n=1 Tax=Gordonia jinhuaensis TaxID=1517702 RepID=A0A916T300_9ACTN|nr:bifunctional oligoribonuclease/PAP phosphatase NrnA [Gordonia jinhuaensis]GGB26735.1 phosphoesterase [Gordonia jinhuaensis]
MSTDTLPADLAAAAKVIAAADSVTIVCHIRPDADTVGSALALALALDKRGTRVEVVYPAQWELPAALAELPGSEMLADSPADGGHAVVVAVDCASPERLGEHAQMASEADECVVIDHHASNPGFGTRQVIDPTADCSAELVLALVEELDVDVDVDIATCVYAGLVTDTGSFRWARPRSFDLAARLLAHGVDGSAITRRLIDTHPVGWLQMVSHALGSATLVADAFDGAGLIYAVIRHADLADLGWEEGESVIDVVRTVDAAEVAVVFKEGTPGEWTVSLRSKSTVDLVPLANRLGGGGHPRASGYTVSGTADEVVGQLLGALD